MFAFVKDDDDEQASLSLRISVIKLPRSMHASEKGSMRENFRDACGFDNARAFPLQALILDTLPCLMYLGGMQQWSSAATDVTQLALGWQNVQSLSDANVQLCDTSRSGKRPRCLDVGSAQDPERDNSIFWCVQLHRKILLTFPHVHGESLQSFFCLSQSHIGKYIFFE